ncbi:MAG: 5'/3'-nucleotidase SurE [Geminicoccaceae bacterium]
MSMRQVPDKPRILVTNDDGIDAPGLAILTRIAKDMSDDVWVVAPLTNQSGTSHALTIQRPLRVRSYGERRYAIDGTPTDCVMIAMQALLEDQRPDLVLSGINRGANVADDVTYSGTIGAAMEATLFDVPAIALSQAYRELDSIPWETAEAFSAQAVAHVLSAGFPPGVLYSVNFPSCDPDAVSGFVAVRHGQRKLGDDIQQRVDPRGDPYYWIGHMRTKTWREPGTDVAAMAAQEIAITPLQMNLSDVAALSALESQLTG